MADRRGARVLAVLCDAGIRPAALRQPLARAAASLADRIVVTEGSHGPKDGGPIIDALLRGARDAGHAPVTLVPERRAAFRHAFAAAAPGDVVLLLGRGRRPVLLRGPDGAGTPFDDVLVARAELERA